MMPCHAHWADLARPDLAGLDRANGIAVLGIGATEQHGPHLPVSVDIDFVEAVIDRALPRLASDIRVDSLRPLAYGNSNEHGEAPGTLSLGATTLLAALDDVGSSLARTDFHRLVLVNGHGGNTPVLDIAARDMKVAHGLDGASSYAFNKADNTTPDERTFGIRAGLVSTSAMLIRLRSHGSGP